MFLLIPPIDLYLIEDNKLNLPRTRSPQLRRMQSPTSSPRKTQDKLQQQQQQPIVPPAQCVSNSATDGGGFSTDDDGEQINIEKLKTIRKMAAQRAQQQQQQQLENNNLNCTDRLIEHVTESSAVTIQKMWRGYHTRKKTKDIAEKLHKQRTHEYIE